MDEISSYCTYVIESKVNERLCIGSTRNITDRFSRHDKGYVRSTKKDRPYRLVYKNKHESLSEARKQENYLKSFKSPKYLRDFLIKGR